MLSSSDFLFGEVITFEKLSQKVEKLFILYIFFVDKDILFVDKHTLPMLSSDKAR
jgi:hypothetical protein